MVRLLAFGIDVSAQMGFIGSFVCTKTCIAINTVRTVFGLNTSDAFVKHRNACYGCCQKLFKLFPDHFVLSTVFLKPFAIIVL